MDTRIYDGDHVLDGRGFPAVLSGAEELIQRALIRLKVKKGAFAPDLQLGSELYKLRRAEDAQSNRIALAYVQEALAAMPEAAVAGVSCALAGPGELCVEVGLLLDGEEYELEVTV